MQSISNFWINLSKSALSSSLSNSNALYFSKASGPAICKKVASLTPCSFLAQFQWQFRIFATIAWRISNYLLASLVVFKFKGAGGGGGVIFFQFFHLTPCKVVLVHEFSVYFIRLNIHSKSQKIQYFLVMASSFLNWSFRSWFSKRSTTFDRKVMTALWMNFTGELSVLLSGTIIRPTKINDLPKIKKFVFIVNNKYNVFQSLILLLSERLYFEHTFIHMKVWLPRGI